MTYRIPSVEKIRDVIRRVLTRTRGLGSLRELTDLVAEELQEEDPRYRVGPERVRRVASRMNAVRTTIHTRRSENVALREVCPVCGGRLRAVRNKTLTGKDVALEVRCTACPYWTGRERRVPVRYAFHLREWRFAHPDAKRHSDDMSTKNPKRL